MDNRQVKLRKILCNYDRGKYKDWDECIEFIEDAFKATSTSTGSTTNSTAIDELIMCPYCKKDDFDLIGLKSHLMHGDCEKWNETIDLNRRF